MTRTIPEQALILTAGEGTRLRPYTDNLPKPLVSVQGQPILFHIFEKLVKDNIKNVVMNLYYLGDMIKEKTLNYPDLNIQYSEEQDLLNTGGGAKQALSLMQDSPFFMINGDAFWNDSPDQSAFQRLADAWDAEKMDILLLLQPIDRMVLTEGVGDYNLSPKGQAIRSKDKTGTHMFAGIRITKPNIIKDVQDDSFSFLQLMDAAEEKGRLHAVVHDNDWHHISTSEDLERVNDSIDPNWREAPQRAKIA